MKQKPENVQEWPPKQNLKAITVSTLAFKGPNYTLFNMMAPMAFRSTPKGELEREVIPGDARDNKVWMQSIARLDVINPPLDPLYLSFCSSMTAARVEIDKPPPAVRINIVGYGQQVMLLNC